MRSSTVVAVDHLDAMPNQDAGDEAVLRVLTLLPAGEPNCFYMDPADRDGRAIVVPKANQPAGAPIDPEAINFGDPISFDVQDGIHKAVLWKGRRIRQRGYSFDAYPGGNLAKTPY